MEGVEELFLIVESEENEENVSKLEQFLEEHLKDPEAITAFHWHCGKYQNMVMEVSKANKVRFLQVILQHFDEPEEDNDDDGDNGEATSRNVIVDLSGICDNQGQTLLHYSTKERKTELTKLLLEQGSCNPNAKDHLLKQTPLFSLVASKDFTAANSMSLFDLLLTKSDVNTRCRTTQESILHRLVLNRAPLYILENLLRPKQKGVRGWCDIDLQNGQGQTALMLALEMKHDECARLLIDRGCRLDLKNKFGETALHIACRKNILPSLKYLLSRTSDRPLPVNEPDLDGNTPLHVVSARGFKEAVDLLLINSKTDPDMVNREDLTAYDLAKEGMFWEIITTLENVTYH